MPESQAGAPDAQQQQQSQQQADPKAGGDQPGQDKPAPRTYTQVEMDRITGKVRENARRDTELRMRREHEARPAPGAGGGEPKAQPKAEADPEPKREGFDNYEEYQREVTRWDARQEAKKESAARDKAAQEKVTREAQEKAQRTWESRIATAASALPDFETVLESGGSEVLSLFGTTDRNGKFNSTPMGNAVLESDIGPRIVYELCKDPENAKRIAALPAYKQAAEIAKIEDRLVAAAAKPGAGDEGGEDDPNKDDKVGERRSEEPARNADGSFKATKKAPEPIEPTGGRSASSSARPSDKDGIKDWMKKRDAEERAARGK